MRQMKVRSGKIKVKNRLVGVQFVFSKTNCNLEVPKIKKKNNYNVDDVRDLIFNENQSDRSGLSWDEEENDDIKDAVWNNISDGKPTDAAEPGNDIPLASLAGAVYQASSSDQCQANNEPTQGVYHWRKIDTIVCDHSFLEELSELLLEDMTPLQYISVVITATLLGINVEQNNIYSFQTIHKSIDTNRAEITSLIGMSIKMGILQLPSYKLYWSQNFLCPRIVCVMPRNCYQELLRYLYFVSNDSISTQDKLAKTRPLISMVREEFVKTEPEECNSVIIPSKTNYSSIRHYNPKKLKRWGLKILFALASLL